jgi:hypothetical protein
MSTLNNDVKVVRIDVPVVLLTILTNGSPNLVFHLRCDSVLTRVHVSHVRVDETLRKLLPSLVLDVVVFSYIQTPDLARRLLKDSEEVKHLRIPHPFVEILFMKQ